jgi:hypothetical protein
MQLSGRISLLKNPAHSTIATSSSKESFRLRLPFLDDPGAWRGQSDESVDMNHLEGLLYCQLLREDSA